jgi:hypothetical protein
MSTHYLAAVVALDPDQLGLVAGFAVGAVIGLTPSIVHHLRWMRRYHQEWLEEFGRSPTPHRPWTLRWLIWAFR